MESDDNHTEPFDPMSDSLHAADPQRNATVMASAGTGKTWLLVTRLVRLLLSGARADGILAVTFTRKAAAEMLTRLNERLLEYVDLDDPGLDQVLRAIGLSPDEQARQRARGLYEMLLFSERPIRATTFHSFCQEILQRFPLEAAIPPAFELLDSAGTLEREAWDALYQEATQQPEGTTAQVLEVLFERCGGLHNTHTALSAFLQYRNDWWAFTEHHGNPGRHAVRTLARLLGTERDTDYEAEFFSPETIDDLTTFTNLLDRHATATNRQHAALVAGALDPQLAPAERFAKARQVFLTASGNPRSRKASKALRRTMGADGEQEFLRLHERLCDRILDTCERCARRNTLLLSQAWFHAGERLVSYFQRIKQERRLLDFADLEWKAYRLLTQADNAHWVQYKLDQRIDHFLIDEFQDTNPTQWRLLLPLLEELAAGDVERQRSVFLVGDDKQSIYRFRRADPRLLQGAGHWLDSRLGAATYSLEDSWRSGPAIIECVNAVFAEGRLHERLPSFKHHDTHRKSLWSRVELLPLSGPQQDEEHAGEPAGELRNPLLAPRVVEEDRRHYEEGRLIAQRIRNMIDSGIPVGEQGGARALRYNDIFILLRKRTHASAIERALREGEIPYLGAERGTLLSSLEINDMEALLTTLIMPYDDLALAQVLRSPLFAADDEDLIRLAGAAGGGHWLERLARVAPELEPRSPLHRAHRLLSRWRELAGTIPVHDLLDRIYSEADAPGRYESAFPSPLKPRVRANLTRFIELALEVDSGRYPSLPNFLNRLRELKRHALEAPDEPPAGGAEDRVCVLTIHAAKGLEAPVVFLADSASTCTRGGAYRAIVEWPTEAERPEYFLLAGRKDAQDSISRGLLEAQEQAEQREDANLLYVALTRARQHLIITGSAPSRGKEQGWYGQIRERLEAVAVREGEALVIESGQPPSIGHRPVQETATIEPPDPRLCRPIEAPAARLEIAPSHSADPMDPMATPGEDGRLHGIAVHRMLELLTSTRGEEHTEIVARTARELVLDPDDARLREWWEEARAVLHEPDFAELFREERYKRAYNEVPVQYFHGPRLVHGIVDRIVLTDDRVLLVDYKTHRQARPDNLDQLAETYRQQMQWYALGIRRLWPGHSLRAALLFTACRRLYPMALE